MGNGCCGSHAVHPAPPSPRPQSPSPPSSPSSDSSTASASSPASAAASPGHTSAAPTPPARAYDMPLGVVREMELRDRGWLWEQRLEGLGDLAVLREFEARHRVEWEELCARAAVVAVCTATCPTPSPQREAPRLEVPSEAEQAEGGAPGSASESVVSGAAESEAESEAESDDGASEGTDAPRDHGDQSSSAQPAPRSFCRRLQAAVAQGRGQGGHGSLGPVRSRCGWQLPPATTRAGGGNAHRCRRHHVFIDASNVYYCMLSCCFTMRLSPEQGRRLALEERSDQVFLTGLRAGETAHPELARHLGLHGAVHVFQVQRLWSQEWRMEVSTVQQFYKALDDASEGDTAVVFLRSADYAGRLDRARLLEEVAGANWCRAPTGLRRKGSRVAMCPGEPYVAGSNIEELRAWEAAGARTCYIASGPDKKGRPREQWMVDEALQGAILDRLLDRIELRGQPGVVARVEGRELRTGWLRAPLDAVGLAAGGSVELLREIPADVAPAESGPVRISVGAPALGLDGAMIVGVRAGSTLGGALARACEQHRIGDCFDIVTGDMDDNKDRVTGFVRATSFATCVERCIRHRIPVRIWSWPVASGSFSPTIEELTRRSPLVSAHLLTAGAVLCNPALRPPVPPAVGRTLDGTVFSWLGDYGFIAPDGNHPDIFCHVSEAPDGLQEGDRVRFKVKPSPTRRGAVCATRLRRLD